MAANSVVNGIHALPNQFTGGERRGEEAAGHGTEECSPFHYSIT